MKALTFPTPFSDPSRLPLEGSFIFPYPQVHFDKPRGLDSVHLHGSVYTPWPKGVAGMSNGIVKRTLATIRKFEKTHRLESGAIILFGGAVRNFLLGNNSANDLDLLIRASSAREAKEIILPFLSFLTELPENANVNLDEANKIGRSIDFAPPEYSQSVLNRLFSISRAFRLGGACLDPLGCYSPKNHAVGLLAEGIAFFLKDLVFPISQIRMDSQGRVIDPFCGLYDLKEKALRWHGHRNAVTSRHVLHALRFKHAHSFSLARKTAGACKDFFRDDQKYPEAKKVNDWVRSIESSGDEGPYGSMGTRVSVRFDGGKKMGRDDPFCFGQGIAEVLYYARNIRSAAHDLESRGFAPVMKASGLSLDELVEGAKKSRIGIGVTH